MSLCVVRARVFSISVDFQCQAGKIIILTCTIRSCGTLLKNTDFVLQGISTCVLRSIYASGGQAFCRATVERVIIEPNSGRAIGVSVRQSGELMTLLALSQLFYRACELTTTCLDKCFLWNKSCLVPWKWQVFNRTIHCLLHPFKSPCTWRIRKQRQQILMVLNACVGWLQDLDDFNFFENWIALISSWTCMSLYNPLLLMNLLFDSGRTRFFVLQRRHKGSP